MININSMPVIEERTHIVQKIQEVVLERICMLDYKEGHQLKEAELAAEFNVSRTPVRDALSRIAHLDLIETRNGVGTVVKRLSDEKIIDVYQARLRLAPLIGELSDVEIIQSHKDTICDLLIRAKALQSSDRAPTYVQSYVQINHELHQTICQLISNSVLRSFWEQTYYQAASVWYRIADITGKEAFSALVTELTELETALNNKDLVAVGYIQRVYIGYGYERIRQHIFSN